MLGKMDNCDVFICTHGRPKHLPAVLDSLKKAKGEFKVWIIDSSDKKLNKKIQKLADEYIHVPGMTPLSTKRNVAIKKSKADIIVFTDDDCIADENWVEELTSGFKNQEIGACTGKTLPLKGYINSEYEAQFSFSKIGNEKKIIKNKLFLMMNRIGHGNNMAFRRKVFEVVGLFNEKKGAGTGIAGEDSEMFYKILRNSYKIAYNPSAIVYHKHLVPSEKLPELANYNGYGWYLFFKENKRIDFQLMYFVLICKYLIKFIRGNREIEKPRLKGILGLEKKKWLAQINK